MPLVVTPELLYNSISRSEYNCGMTSTMLKSDDHVITKVVLHACYSQIPPVIPNRCTYYSQCITHYSLFSFAFYTT